MSHELHVHVSITLLFPKLQISVLLGAVKTSVLNAFLVLIKIPHAVKWATTSVAAKVRATI